MIIIPLSKYKLYAFFPSDKVIVYTVLQRDLEISGRFKSKLFRLVRAKLIESMISWFLRTGDSVLLNSIGAESEGSSVHE